MWIMSLHTRAPDYSWALMQYEREHNASQTWIDFSQIFPGTGAYKSL